MALICARCATDNPQSNAFCMSCGASLAGSPPMAPPDAAPPPPPPAATDPAAFLPPDYVSGSSPYLPPPPPGTAPAHRMSGTSIIAIVAAVLVIAGGGGIAYAVLHKGATTPAPTAGIPVSVPTSAPAAGGPTSAATLPPSTPVSGPSGSTGGETISAPFAKVFVPSGFSVTDQESDVVILTPDSGSNEAVGVQSEQLTGTTTNAQLDQALLVGDQKNGDPSAKFCSTKAPSQAQVLGSGGAITADVISICENLTPGSGPAFQAVDAYIDAVAQTADGSLKAVWFEILAPAGDFTSFTRSVPASLIDQTTFTDAAPPH